MVGWRHEITHPLAKNKPVAWLCREQAGCWITSTAGTRWQQIAWHTETRRGGGGAREALRDFARQTGKGRQKNFVGLLFTFCQV